MQEALIVARKSDQPAISIHLCLGDSVSRHSPGSSKSFQFTQRFSNDLPSDKRGG